MRNVETPFNPEDYIPHHGKQFEEDGKTVCWVLASPGDSVSTVMSRYRGSGPKPLDAKEIDTPEGKMVIAKWEVKKE
ncbi:hypothetical protein HYW17_05985 [Candidatus Uhrbacteria bacterium]|nr:hypothetical protein [Candidatus Uhrbacteria bacterium]